MTQTVPNEAKEFLKRVPLLNVFINEKLEELYSLKEMTLKITSTWKSDVVATSSSQDKLGNAVAKIIDLQDEINNAVDDYINQKKKVDAIVSQIEDPDQAAVLYKRYFQNEPWEQIACEMGYTYRHITRMHGIALNSVDKLLKKQKLSVNVLECPNS